MLGSWRTQPTRRDVFVGCSSLLDAAGSSPPPRVCSSAVCYCIGPQVVGFGYIASVASVFTLLLSG